LPSLCERISGSNAKPSRRRHKNFSPEEKFDLRSLREREAWRISDSMRIIGGEFASRRLRVPPGAVRPTAERVREALFSMLAHRGAIERARVLDAFAGSGALGLEALSRGAQRVVFVESAREAAKTLGANIAALELGARARVVVRDASAALTALASEGECFDLCFVDPPYASPLAAQTLAHLADGGLLSSRAVVVAESDRRHAPGPIPGLSLALERRYGDTLISLYELANRTANVGDPPA
jgi:16S rRNA (guanine966-N2)-methyltransferase